jgi:GAF domain-containing protein
VTQTKGPKRTLESARAVWAASVAAVRTEMPQAPAITGSFASAASTILAVFILDSEGGVRLPVLVGTIAALLVSLISSWVSERWRASAGQAEKDERVDLEVTINDAFIPVLRLLAEMSRQDATAKGVTRSSVTGQVCSAIPLVVPGVDRLRIVVYTHERQQGTRPRALRAVYWTGREDKPRPIVDRDRARGERVWTWMDERQPRFVPDTDDAEGESRGRAYRTYIAVPLLRGSTHLGMLTIDAPTPGDLDETNVSAVALAGAMLSTAFAHAGSPPPLDE